MLPRPNPVLRANLNNFAGTMDSARRLLRLFESAREYATLLKLNKREIDQTSKYVGIFNQCVMMLYWAVENLYILGKLRILPINSDFFGKATGWIGLIVYIATLITQKMTLDEIDKQIEEAKKVEPTGEKPENAAKLKALLMKRQIALFIIAKETADNIGLLPYLGFVKNSWLMSMLSSLGCLFNGAMSLYLRYK